MGPLFGAGSDTGIGSLIVGTFEFCRGREARVIVTAHPACNRRAVNTAARRDYVGGMNTTDAKIVALPELSIKLPKDYRTPY
jgi:hypothetical protein